MYQGKKVRLRAYRREDIDHILKYINDPEVKRGLTPGVPFPFTVHDEEKWLESQSALSESTYNFAIESLANGKYLGGCGVHNIQWKNRVCEVGLFLGQENWGQGYGSDGLRTLLHFVFDEMNMNKVKLNVFSFNERAVTCYEQCGFQQEGLLKQEIFREGQYHDMKIMSLFRADWENGNC